jgi:hypothetical protein
LPIKKKFRIAAGMRLVIIYDLASIDYILSLKEESSLYYLYWAFSRNNRFLSFGKARLASLMGPAAIIKHYPNIFIQELSKYIHGQSGKDFEKLENIQNSSCK